MPILFGVIRILKLISAKGYLFYLIEGYMEDPIFKDANRQQVLTFLTNFSRTEIKKEIFRRGVTELPELSVAKKIFKREAVKVLGHPISENRTKGLNSESIPTTKPISKKNGGKSNVMINQTIVGPEAEKGREIQIKLKIRKELNDELVKLIEGTHRSKKYLVRADSLESLKKITAQRHEEINFDILKYLYDNLIICLNDDERLAILSCVKSL